MGTPNAFVDIGVLSRRAGADKRGASASTAHWASWADSLRTVRQRHPATAERKVAGLVGDDPVACFHSDHDGAALEVARRRKERTYPELAGEGGRARFVVLAAEVGGRWSKETATFLAALAKARAESSPLILQGRVKAR